MSKTISDIREQFKASNWIRVYEDGLIYYCGLRVKALIFRKYAIGGVVINLCTMKSKDEIFSLGEMIMSLEDYYSLKGHVSHTETINIMVLKGENYEERKEKEGKEKEGTRDDGSSGQTGQVAEGRTKPV